MSDTTIPNVTLPQLKRILLANYFTPGRASSKGVHDPVTARQLVQADQRWAEAYQLSHGRAPSDEEIAARQQASRVTWGACPVLVLGPPGVGKTAIGEGYAESLGLEPNTIIASQQQPEDVGGYAIPDMENRRMIRLPDTWIDQVNEAVNGAVQCFDELTTADESMMAALLRVFSDRAAGDRQLSPRVRLIAFGNRPGEAPNARTLDPAAANRFAHFTFTGTDGEGWASWLLDELDVERVARDPNAIEARVLAQWPRAFARSKALVAQYIKSNSGALHAMTRGDQQTRLTADNPHASGPWASHRTWEIATRILASADIHGLADGETRLWLASVIGDEADQLMTWITDQDLPDLVELLHKRGKFTCRKTGKLKTWKHNQKRLDRTYTVLTGLATTLRDMQPQSTPKDLLPHADWVFELLEQVGQKDPDMVVRPAQMLAAAGIRFLTDSQRKERQDDPTKWPWGFLDGGDESDPATWCAARRVAQNVIQPFMHQVRQPGA